MRPAYMYSPMLLETSNTVFTNVRTNLKDRATRAQNKPNTFKKNNMNHVVYHKSLNIQSVR